MTLSCFETVQPFALTYAYLVLWVGGCVLLFQSCHLNDSYAGKKKNYWYQTIYFLIYFLRFSFFSYFVLDFLSQCLCLYTMAVPVDTRAKYQMPKGLELQRIVCSQGCWEIECASSGRGDSAPNHQDISLSPFTVYKVILVFFFNASFVKRNFIITHYVF